MKDSSTEDTLRNSMRSLFQKSKNLYKDLKLENADKINLVDDDIITKVDIEMTSLIIDHFREEKYSFRFESEEISKSKDINISNKNTENLEKSKGSDDIDYTVIFDEIDGTVNLRKNTASFGPIVAIAEGENPKFKDIVVSGFLDLKSGEYYEAYRDRGAFKMKNFGMEKKNKSTKEESGKKRDFTDDLDYSNLSDKLSKIESNNRETLEESPITEIIIDQPMLGKIPKIAENAWKYFCSDFGSQGIHYGLISDGRKNVFITGGHSHIPGKDKNTPEELAGMYLIVKEAGGTVINWKGEKIENEKIGLLDGKNYNVIVASTEKLARQALDEIIPEKYT